MAPRRQQKRYYQARKDSLPLLPSIKESLDEQGWSKNNTTNVDIGASSSSSVSLRAAPRPYSGGTLTSTSTRTITSRMYDYSSSRLKMQHDAPDKTTLLPGAFNCTTTWFDQPLDHFNFRDAKQTYKQRVLIYDKFWSRNALDGSRGPIFFYCGNEGDVTLYANNTGLMWENAEQFGAALIFAEHRYYGQSHPFEQNNSREHMQYLTHEQALADYANLIYTFKQNNSAASSRVIAFGGSYGGMLAAWIRIKYPSAVHGSIAASAPILAFPLADRAASYQGTSYWKVVTHNAKSEAGSALRCATNVRRSWPIIERYGQTETGRTRLAQLFHLCDDAAALQTEEQVRALSMSIMMAFDNMAMGNYPYPSSYLTGGTAVLPAWPMRAACEHLKGALVSDEALLSALDHAAAVYTNASGALVCNRVAKLVDFDGIWDYQWCTELMPQESYFDSNGVSDMFWPRNVSLDSIRRRCEHVWGTTPRPYWLDVSYGGRSLDGASNIVFSNGLLDPWSSGGVVHPVPSSVTTVLIEDGAHHLDLFFSHPDDPVSVIEARNVHVRHMAAWINDDESFG